jgi:hypothetical protein
MVKSLGNSSLFFGIPKQNYTKNQHKKLRYKNTLIKDFYREKLPWGSVLEDFQFYRKNTTIDWTIRESVQAKLRVYVKMLLKKYNYPPDKQESATRTVLEQTKLLAKDWTGENEEKMKHLEMRVI